MERAATIDAVHIAAREEYLEGGRHFHVAPALSHITVTHQAKVAPNAPVAATSANWKRRLAKAGQTISQSLSPSNWTANLRFATRRSGAKTRPFDFANRGTRNGRWAKLRTMADFYRHPISWTRDAWKRRHLARLIFAAFATLAPTSVLAQAAVPSWTGWASARVLEVFYDEEAIIAHSEQNFDCSLATRISVSDDPLPIYYERCENPVRVGSALTGKSLELLVNAIVALEGEFRDGSSLALNGINLPGKAKIITSLGATAGTAGPLSVWELQNSEGQPSSFEKADDLLRASIFFESRTSEQLEVFATMAEACLGQGITMARAATSEICAIFINGETDDNLTPRTACLIAAGYYRHVKVTSTNASSADIKAATDRFDWRRSVAHDCLTKLEQMDFIDSETRDNEADALNGMQVPTIERVIGDRGADPLDWRLSVLPGATYVLRDAMAMMPRDNMRLSMAMTSRGQKAFNREIEAGLTDLIAPLLAPEVCIDGCSNEIDYAFAMAKREQDGSLNLIGASSSDPALLWGAIENSEIQPSSRSVGSETKVAALPCVLRHVPVTSQSMFCRNSRFDMTDPGNKPATDCSSPSHFSSPFDILARSGNSDWAEWVSKVPPATLRQCLSDHGADFHGDLDALQLARGATLGYSVTFSLAELLRNISSASFGPTRLPVLFEQQDGGTALDVREGLPADQQAMLARLLAASSTSPNGTLRGFSLQSKAMPDAHLRASKSGTTDSGASKRAVRDKLVLVSFTAGGDEYSAIAMIGAPRSDLDLGRSVSTYALRNVLRDAITANFIAIDKDGEAETLVLEEKIQ